MAIPSCRPPIHGLPDEDCGGIRKYTYFISIMAVLYMNGALCAELWNALVTYENDEYADKLKIHWLAIWVLHFLSFMVAAIVEIVVFFISGGFWYPFNGLLALLAGGSTFLFSFCGIGIYQWYKTEECVDKDVSKYRIALYICLSNLGLFVVFVYVMYNAGFQILLQSHPTGWQFYTYSTVVLFCLRKGVNFIFTKIYFILNQSDNIAVGFMFNFIVHCSFLSFMRGASADVAPINMLLISIAEVGTLIFSFVSLITNKFTYLPWRKKKATDMSYSEIFSHDESMYTKVQYLGMEEMIELIMSFTYGIIVLSLYGLPKIIPGFPQLVCGIHLTCFGYTEITQFTTMGITLTLTLIFEIFCGYLMHLALNKWCKINILAMLFWMFHERNNEIFRVFLSTLTAFTLITYYSPFCIDVTMEFLWIGDSYAPTTMPTCN